MERLSKVLEENSKKFAIVTGAVVLSVLSGVYLYKKLIPIVELDGKLAQIDEEIP